jgi:hypothetical protein
MIACFKKLKMAVNEIAKDIVDHFRDLPESGTCI